MAHISEKLEFLAHMGDEVKLARFSLRIFAISVHRPYEPNFDDLIVGLTIERKIRQLVGDATSGLVGREPGQVVR